MELFKLLFTSKARVSPEPTAPEIFQAAGFAFTNGNVMLAGYQPYKKKPIITGLGGCRKLVESSFETALREVLEELLGFESLTLKQIHPIMERFAPKEKRENGSYIFYVYTFDDLERLLKVAKNVLKTAPLYDTFPKTLTELLLQRNKLILDKPKYKPEVKHLCIIPVVLSPFAKLIIDENLIQDMRIFTKIIK